MTTLPGRPARLGGAGQVLQFPIDDIVNERHVVDDREMGALPDMDLQTRIGEASPAQSVFARYVRVAFCCEAGDRNFPRRLGTKW